MRSHTRYIFAGSFGALILLLAFSGWDAFRRGSGIYAELGALYSSYQEAERLLKDVESETRLIEIYARDYLLDPSHIAGEYYRGRLLDARRRIQSYLARLQALLSEEHAGQLQALSTELDAYWESLDPLFEWSPRQKMVLSALFLRQQVLPRREAALGLAEEVRRLNEAHLARQRQAVTRSQQEFRRDLARLLAVGLSLAVAVAAVGFVRISRLEQRTALERRRTEEAEARLRRLSRQLVAAQEAERKSISRELHDQVGQMLTALRFQLGGLEKLSNGAEPGFRAHLDESKRLAEDVVKTVRDIALGLRPSMLDDFGLAPALEWQARDFSRRYGVPVELQLEGELNRLPDGHRTCVYRLVQEALTNCARHAHSKSIRVVAHRHKTGISVSIQDDGQGFPAEQPRGLGLVGIDERVQALGGSMNVFSQPGRGTVLSAEIPLHTGGTA